MKSFLKYVFASTIGFFIAQMILFVFGIFVIGIIIGTSAVKKSKPLEALAGKDKILKLELAGEIVEKDKFGELYIDEEIPFFGKEMPQGLYEIQKSLAKAAKDENIKGLYIEVDNVRAGWATLESLRKSIVDFKKSGKFVYAYGDMFSEASYFVASCADQIFAYPQGDFELNGFAAVVQFYKETLDRLNIKPIIFRAGAYKSAIEPFIKNEMSPESKEQTQAYIDSLWNVFVKEVSISRKISEVEVYRIANELLVTSATEAKEKKLVDQLKYEDEVLEFIKGAIGSKKKKIPFVSIKGYLHGGSDGSSFSMKMFSRNGSDDDDSSNDDESEEDNVKGNEIAVIFAEGEIVRGSSYDRLMGAKSIVKELRAARKNKKIEAVVLRINSPGGSALASDEIWREVFLTNKVKPVIASMGNIAASGGYYIAAGASHIMAEKNTLTGSIGVFGMSLVMDEFFKEKLGMSFDRVKTHQYSDSDGYSREPSAYEVSIVNKEIDRVYNRFLQVVSGNRGMSVSTVKELAGGRIWSGTGAQKNKLVDSLGGLNDAILWSAKKAGLGEDYKVILYPRNKSPFSLMFDSFTKVVSKMASQVLPKTLSIWLDDFKASSLGDSIDTISSRKEKGVYMLMPMRMVVE